jgi:hypothetical protein
MFVKYLGFNYLEKENELSEKNTPKAVKNMPI